jgi:hypothetical protein
MVDIREIVCYNRQNERIRRNDNEREKPQTSNPWKGNYTMIKWRIGSSLLIHMFTIEFSKDIYYNQYAKLSMHIK